MYDLTQLAADANRVRNSSYLLEAESMRLASFVQYLTDEKEATWEDAEALGLHDESLFDDQRIYYLTKGFVLYAMPQFNDMWSKLRLMVKYRGGIVKHEPVTLGRLRRLALGVGLEPR